MPPNKNFELGSRGKIHCKANGSSDVYWKRNQSDELPENVKDDNGTLIFENVDISMKGKTMFLKVFHLFLLFCIKKRSPKHDIQPSTSYHKQKNV